MYDRWVIDAGMCREDLWCFCPIEGDLNGEYTLVVGVNYLGDQPPGKLVGIVHPDGQETAEKWIEANKSRLSAIRSEVA